MQRRIDNNNYNKRKVTMEEEQVFQAEEGRDEE